jgi:hypothetical protein
MKTKYCLFIILLPLISYAQGLRVSNGKLKAAHTNISQIDLGRGGSTTSAIFNRIDGVTNNLYYLSSSLSQNPLKPDVILQVSGEFPLGHVWSSTNKFVYQRSTDHGLTWSAKATFYSAGGSLGTVDGGGGYSSDGRYHQFIDVHGGTAEGGVSTTPHSLIYCYSDDDGTTVTATDITSVIPSDGLASYRFYGNLVEVGGYLFYNYYKLTDEGDFTNSARYILKKPLSGGSWTSILVETGSNYLNESTIAWVGGNYLIYVSRNDVTKEFTLYRSSDLGETWSNLGDLSFGEAFTTPGPPRLAPLYISGTLVIACYYPDRQNAILKVVYGTADNIRNNGVSGFDNTTKTTLVDNASQEQLHYGQVLHHYNNFNAIASYATEAGAANILVKGYLDIFWVRSSHYPTVKTALGL